MIAPVASLAGPASVALSSARTAMGSAASRRCACRRRDWMTPTRQSCLGGVHMTPSMLPSCGGRAGARPRRRGSRRRSPGRLPDRQAVTGRGTIEPVARAHHEHPVDRAGDRPRGQAAAPPVAGLGHDGGPHRSVAQHRLPSDDRRVDRVRRPWLTGSGLPQPGASARSNHPNAIECGGVGGSAGGEQRHNDRQAISATSQWVRGRPLRITNALLISAVVLSSTSPTSIPTRLAAWCRHQIRGAILQEVATRVCLAGVRTIVPDAKTRR